MTEEVRKVSRTRPARSSVDAVTFHRLVKGRHGGTRALELDEGVATLSEWLLKAWLCTGGEEFR